jgi:hypothetical protein
MLATPRTLLIFVLACVTALTAAPALAQKEEPDDTKLPPGQIEFEQSIVALGDIWDARPVDALYPFTNVGEGPLVLGKFTATCSCTVAKLDKVYYEPGEKGVIRVTLNPRGREGSQYKLAWIETNDPRASRATLIVTATIHKLVWSDPPFFEQREHRKGTPLETTIMLRCQEEKFELLAVEPLPGRGIDVEPGETTRVEEDGIGMVYRTPIRIRLRDSVQEGRMSERIRVRVAAWHGDERKRHDAEAVEQAATDAENAANESADDNDQRRIASPRTNLEPKLKPYEYEIIIPVSIEIVGNIVVEPKMLRLGSVETGGTISQTLEVRSRDGSAFNITDARILGSEAEYLDVTVTPPADDGAPWRVTVEGTAPDTPRRLAGAIIIETNLGGGESTQLRYYGVVRRPATNDR